MAGRPQMTVVDSSVAVKWFSEEPGSEEALKLAESHVEGSIKLWATNLLYAEVTNALRSRPDYNPVRLREAVDHLFNLHLNTLPTGVGTLARAGEIAYEADVTIYDALPIAVAETRGTTCITADKETQYEKLKPRGYLIELL